MPSNNLLANNHNANLTEMRTSGFNQINMSQTGPRIRHTMEGDDLPAPTEIYNRVGPTTQLQPNIN